MRSIVALPFLIISAPVFGAETPWVDIAPEVEIRLISDGVISPQGKALFGLELKMPQSTNTYWRVPGQAGFPAQYDFSGSEGVTGATLQWPYPTRKTIGNLLDYVYQGDVIIPFEADVEGEAGLLKLDVVLGICEEICIPAQASLSLPINADQPDRANGVRIKQALAQSPIDWDLDKAPFGSIMLAEDGKTLAVVVNSPEVDPDSIILDMGLSGPIFGAPQKSLGEPIVLLPILGKTDNSELVGQSVQITFLTDLGAYAVSGIIEPASR